MKIKQQKLIKSYLIEEFHNDKANTIFNKQNQLLYTLIDNTKGKSEKQMNTLIQTILPRIALYKTLLNENISEEDAYEYIKKYMFNKIAIKKHNSMLKMEKVPGFYKIYRNIFLKIMSKTDLQENTSKRGDGYFDVTITKCLWHTACVENGCPNLCHLFCDVDDITYGGLKKMGFSRTKTLGYGNDCCDFHFYKK